jgi:hypothetical protein
VSTDHVSEVSLIPTLPPEALAAPKGPAPGVTRMAGRGPATTAEAADGPARAGDATDPFAALLQGFLASSQPGTSPDAPTADAQASDLAPAADAGSGAPILIASVAQGSGPAGLPDGTAQTPPGDLRTGAELPGAGKALPPDLGLPASTGPVPPVPQAGATNADSAGAVPAPDGVQAQAVIRISLADLDAARSRQVASGDAAGLPTLADTSAPDALAFASVLADGQAPGMDTPEKPPSLPIPSGADLQRLALGLSVNGSPDLVPAQRAGPLEATGTPGRDTASFQTASPATEAGGGLGRLLNGSLGGFPPLQPLGQPRAWSEGLGDRLLTLAGPGTHSARLTLHPESLGTLDVEIRIDDGNAQVWFGTSQPQTRDAIEGSLPRLREMFADQGITLTRTHVDTGQDRRPPEAPPERPKATPWDRATDRRPSLATLLAPASLTTPSGTRLLDVWA